MLDGMRRMSQGILGRIIMGLVMGFISLSFAVWGVGNIFVGYGAGNVAKVGDVEISTDALRQSYQIQLQNLQQQSRRAVTNDEAHKMGLDRQALGQLVANAALDNKSRALGLAISDQEIARKILTEKDFQGPTGKFEPGKFNEMLRQNGYSEQTFVREQRKQYLRQEIADALTGGTIVPLATKEAIHKFRNETRSIDYMEIPVSAAGEIAAPDDAALQAYFDSRKQNFRAPEYRGVVTLALEPADLADPAKISDEAAQKRYDEVKAQRYGSPAMRHAEQVVFKDEETAKQASEAVKGGKSLAEAAEALKLPVADLGNVPKSGIFDKALAEVVFALADGAVSEPVKSQFGYSIAHLISATPESVKPFAEVAAELKAEMARDTAKKEVGILRDKIEDERTSGKPLEEAAAAAGKKAVKIEAIDQNGLDKAGAEVPGLVQRDALLRAVFASNIGVDNETLTTPGGGYVWFEVAAIEPARDQTLAEVKDKAAAAWRDDEIARRLSEKSADLAKKINDGGDFAAVAKEAGLEVKTASDVRRVDAGSVPQSVVLRVFSLPVGQAGSASADGEGRIVFKILDAATPPMDPDSDIMKAVDTQLKQSLAEDVLAQFMGKAQTDLGVTINQAELRNATGVTDTGDQ